MIIRINFLCNIFFIFLFFTLLSCNTNKVRYPINKKQHDYYIQKSISLNKKIFIFEDKIIKNYIDGKRLKFKVSPYNFFYYFKEDNSKSIYKPMEGDKVTLEYKIMDMNDNILYSSDLDGNKTFIVDRSQEIKGINEGVKLMTKGDLVVFLFPSFLAYGVSGDGNKIKYNQPIIFEAKLVFIDRLTN